MWYMQAPQMHTGFSLVLNFSIMLLPASDSFTNTKEAGRQLEREGLEHRVVGR
jgi:hypothetical protein